MVLPLCVCVLISSYKDTSHPGLGPILMTSSSLNYLCKGLMFLFLFFFLPHCTACRILVPRPGIEPVPSAVEAWSLNHWTTREVPKGLCLNEVTFWGPGGV